MKVGDKVKWIDPVSKRVKTGKLLEQHTVVAESNTIQNLDDPYEPLTFKDVNHKEWDIKCDQDGRRYCFEEKDLETIKAN